MTLLKKIKPVHIFILFLVLHIGLLNINAAEWGDSYRILRAAEYIRNAEYPEDEKRPPLFSVVLASHPKNVDPVVWGRLVMFGLSLTAFYVFYRLVREFFPTKRDVQVLALLLFTLNPVFLYWSIRIMADVPFALLAMLAIFRLVVWRGAFFKRHALVLGVIAGLGVLLRFEGYVLFGALGLGILFLDGFSLNLRVVGEQLKKNFVRCVVYVAAFLVTLAPYWYIRNPLSSSYFEEPGGRVYDLNAVAIYVLSLLFLFGFTSAVYFFWTNKRDLAGFLKNNVAIAAFLVVELLLILAWPAALPRIFVPTIPFLILLLAPSIANYFEATEPKQKRSLVGAVVALVLLGIFVAGQVYFKLQFLVLIKWAFVAVAVLGVLQAWFIYKKAITGFVAVVILSMLIWSGSVIWIHKDIFRSVKEANEYIISNLTGKIAYNDISSVTEWYLLMRSGPDISASYLDATVKDNRDFFLLAANQIDYLLITNEHNTDTTLDLSEWLHLKEIQHFEHEVNGKVFWTKIIEVRR